MFGTEESPDEVVNILVRSMVIGGGWVVVDVVLVEVVVVALISLQVGTSPSQ